MRQENVLGKEEPFELYYGVAFVFAGPSGCVNRTRLWPPRRDDRSGIPISAGETRRFDWPARVLDKNVSTRIDR